MSWCWEVSDPGMQTIIINIDGEADQAYDTDTTAKSQQQSWRAQNCSMKTNNAPLTSRQTLRGKTEEITNSCAE